MPRFSTASGMTSRLRRLRGTSAIRRKQTFAECLEMPFRDYRGRRSHRCRGKGGDVNLQLSINRVTTVCNYLLGSGVFPTRLPALAAGENN